MSGEGRRAELRPRARHDIVDLAVYIADQSPDAAFRLMDAVEQTSAFLLANSEAGAFYPAENSRLAGIRVFQVRSFPNHLIFYRESASGIQIVRVLHGARNVDAVLGEE